VIEQQLSGSKPWKQKNSEREVEAEGPRMVGGNLAEVSSSSS
jgi:hypothetical protein